MPGSGPNEHLAPHDVPIGLDAKGTRKEKIVYHLENSLMLVTALSPVIGYQKAVHIAEAADAQGTTRREAALQFGDVDAATFDKVVDPKTMVGMGLAGA